MYRPVKPVFVSISFASSGDETTTFSCPPRRMVINGPYLRDICVNSRWGSFPTTWNKFPTIGIGDGPGGRFPLCFERNQNLHAKMAKHAAISIANKSMYIIAWFSTIVLVFLGNAKPSFYNLIVYFSSLLIS